MSRFVEVNGVYINVDSIKCYYQDTNDRLHIEFADSTEKNFYPNNVEYTMEELSGSGHVVQVIPVTGPMYAVYENKEPGTYFAVPVYYLALCADGEIRSVECYDGKFECGGYGDYYKGLYHKDQLEQFPGAIDSVEP